MAESYVGETQVKGKYYIIRPEDRTQDDLNEDRVVTKIWSTDDENDPGRKLLADICIRLYDPEKEDPITYFGHPLYNTLDDAYRAWSLLEVKFIEIVNMDGSVTYGYANDANFTKLEQWFRVEWLDRTIIVLPRTEIKKVTVKTCKA